MNEREFYLEGLKCQFEDEYFEDMTFRASELQNHICKVQYDDGNGNWIDDIDERFAVTFSLYSVKLKLKPLEDCHGYFNRENLEIGIDDELLVGVIQTKS